MARSSYRGQCAPTPRLDASPLSWDGTVTILAFRLAAFDTAPLLLLPASYTLGLGWLGRGLFAAIGSRQPIEI